MKFEIQFNSIQIIEVEISSNINHIDTTIFGNELILVHKFANKQINFFERFLMIKFLQSRLVFASLNLARRPLGGM